jgi:hypothetical protein
MLKVRYLRLRLPISFEALAERASRWCGDENSRLRIVRSTASELILNFTAVRYISVTEIDDVGAQILRLVPTVDQHSFRLFSGNSGTYLSIVNPSRGAKAVESVLEQLLEGDSFSLEPLEIKTELIQRHIRKFSLPKMVSAKVKDFRVNETAIGRLEISSKEGLPKEIAPFLLDKFYRIDSVTYEVTYKFVQGLIWYSSAGTVKVSGPLVDVAFPLFESEL